MKYYLCVACVNNSMPVSGVTVCCHCEIVAFSARGAAHVWSVCEEELFVVAENTSCTYEALSKHSGYDTPSCPTGYGSYVVPVLLGIHVMVTNVLLLNLLIARFG